MASEALLLLPESSPLAPVRVRKVQAGFVCRLAWSRGTHRNLSCVATAKREEKKTGIDKAILEF